LKSKISFYFFEYIKSSWKFLFSYKQKYRKCPLIYFYGPQKWVIFVILPLYLSDRCPGSERRTGTYSPWTGKPLSRTPGEDCEQRATGRGRLCAQYFTGWLLYVGTLLTVVVYPSSRRIIRLIEGYAKFLRLKRSELQRTLRHLLICLRLTPRLDFCIGVDKKFIGFVWSPTRPNTAPPPPHSHILSVYTLTRGGGGEVTGNNGADQILE
jgi:hypothetical protein